MLKVSTFCSGIGSPEVALKDLGVEHEIVFACEKDKYARETYLANHTTNKMFEDMTTMDMSQDNLYSDLCIGGIPCQAFSLAGKRLGELDPRGLLFYNFYDYIKQQQPKYFIIENVKGLLSDAKGKTFDTWISLLSKSVNNQENLVVHDDSLLYNIHHTVLNSKNFDVPQNRERVFIVGIRNDLPNDFKFPHGFPLTKRLKDILEPVVDEKYYLSDKMLEGLVLNKNGTGFINQDTQASQVFSTESVSPTISAGTHGYALGYINEPFCVAMRGRNPENSSDRTTGAPTEQRLEANSQGITNTITSVQKDNLIVVGNLDGHEQDGRIYSEEGISPTLDTKCYRRPNIYSNRIRRLTELECMRLQGFPDDFKRVCSSTQQYKMAGNSITTFVIRDIIKNLLHL